MSDKFCLNVNLANLAVTQYCNYSFNSFCKIGDAFFGADETGIYELTGTDDAGTDIDAFAELIVSDFGISNMKRIRSVYVGGESDGGLTLTVKNDENNLRLYAFNLTSGNKQSGAMVNVGRDGISRYWNLRIDNIGGCYFAIDDIEVLAVILGRKPR